MAHFSFYWLNHYSDLADDIGEEYLTDDIDKEWMREKGLRLGGFEEIKNEGRKRPFWVDPNGIVYYYEDLKRLKKKKSKDDDPPRDNDWEQYVKDVANPMPVLNSYNFVTDSKATKNRYSPNPQTAKIDELYVKDALPSPNPQKEAQEPSVPSVGSYNPTPTFPAPPKPKREVPEPIVASVGAYNPAPTYQKPVKRPIHVKPKDCKESLEAAYMADDVYRDHEVKLQGGWERSSLKLKFKKEDPDTGLFSDLYERRNKDGSVEYAYVFRGTEALSLYDWENDGLQFPGMAEQYDQAAKIADELHNLFLRMGKKLTFIGHSLGGGLASLASRITGRPAITFNAAGLSQATIFKYNAYRMSTIRAFVVEDEMIDYLQRKLSTKAAGNIIYLEHKTVFNQSFTYTKYATFNPMIQFDPLYPWVRRVSLVLRAIKHKMGVVIAALKERCK